MERIKKFCSVVRVIAHSQVKLLYLRLKKVHIAEIRINGRDAAAKAAFAKSLFERKVSVTSVYRSWSLTGTLAVNRLDLP
jgi:large subunit ribosomal protein L3e